MQKIDKVFVVAMDCEAETVTRHLSDIAETTRWGHRVVTGKLNDEMCAVVVSGIGKSNAAAAAQLALSLFDAKILLNAGVAGGLQKSMCVAELYEVKAAVQYDFDLTQLNHTPMGTLNEYQTPELPLAVTGKFPSAILGTGDRFNDDADDFKLLTSVIGATLRDMEGGAIAHVALRAQVPCYSLKGVSDVAGSASTTEQYLKNLSVALEKLAAAIPGFFAAVK
ncbi:MAG: 5'-methylthioadenosine/S-adenosylhomocysteine nucleosidase [Victivallaceae bacterium]|nr:5'-methylthioadenosine/S-adenosylhomocysteine nucleosidase [Victivallaceae bacterium]